MSYKEGKMELATGIEVFYRTWKPKESKGIVIGIHGFVEHSGRYTKLGKYLEKNGYTLAMYDLRGHGKTASQDDFGHVDRFNSFVTDTEAFSSSLLNDRGTESAFLLGHSMGGLIVLYMLTRAKIRLKGAITSGPSLSMNSTSVQRIMLSLTHAISPKTRVKLPIDPSMLSHDPAVGPQYMEDPLVCKRPSVSLIYELYQGSKEIWNHLQEVSTPVLMLHGSDDHIVPTSVTPQAYEKISTKDKSKKIYDTFYHEILNEKGKEEVYSDILTWMSNR